MRDYSDSQISASFPGIKVYLCYFHREQPWEWWVKDHKHGLSSEKADELLEVLQACAWAPPVEGHEKLPFDHHYKTAVNKLQESGPWIDSTQVKAWLRSKWLQCPQVC